MMEWLKEQLEEGARVGVDPTLVAAGTFEKYKKELNGERRSWNLMYIKPSKSELHH